MAGNIVIVDDFPLTLQFIEYHLQLAGFKNLTTFENPLDVLSYMQKGNNPYLIITDFQMPYLNGVQLLNQIKNTFGFFPSIITTADCSALTSGYEQYPVLVKGSPDFIADLLNMIRKLTSCCQPVCFASPEGQNF